MNGWNLLAEADSLVVKTRELVDGDNPLSKWMAYGAVVLGLVGLVWMGWSLLSRLRDGDKMALQTPEGLFQQLCRVHKLNRTEKNLLSELNSHLPAKEWCLVFIDSQILQEQCRGGLEVTPWVRLGTKVFGDDFTL